MDPSFILGAIQQVNNNAIDEAIGAINTNNDNTDNTDNTDTTNPQQQTIETEVEDLCVLSKQLLNEVFYVGVGFSGYAHPLG